MQKKKCYSAESTQSAKKLLQVVEYFKVLYKACFVLRMGVDANNAVTVDCFILCTSSQYFPVYNTVLYSN